MSTRLARLGRYLAVPLLVGSLVFGCGSPPVDVGAGQVQVTTTSLALPGSSTSSTEPPATTAPSTTVAEKPVKPEPTTDETILASALPSVDGTFARWGLGLEFAACVVGELGERLDGGDLEFALGELTATDSTSEQWAALAETNGIDAVAAFRINLVADWSAQTCQATQNPDPGQRAPVEDGWFDVSAG